MRVFLDVGAHIGETVEAVLDPKYRFDRIVCFEPVASCHPSLLRFSDPRIEILPYGLWNRTCDHRIFGAGSLAGSVFPDMEEIANGGDASESCRFVRATDWLRENTEPGDTLIMKLNCEGSECDIIEDLLESGEITRISSIMVDFDVRKIPSQRHREAEIRERLARAELNNYRYCEDVMIGRTHLARIQNWLREIGADRCPTPTKVRQVAYLARAPLRVSTSVVGMRVSRVARLFARALGRTKSAT